MAGLLAGSASTLLLTPVDLLTVRMQVAEGKFQGFFPAARELARTDGVRALWNGLTPNLVSSASAWGLYFLLYNKAKATLSGGGANDRLSASQHLLASGAAGAATAVSLNPVWVVKARLVRAPSLQRGLRRPVHAEGRHGPTLQRHDGRVRADMA